MFKKMLREKVGSLEGNEANGEQLLPGIPNDIVLANVSPKLPWREFPVLSTVSRAWHEAIRSRQVYHERVRSHSTETLILLELHRSCRSVGNSVYLLKDKIYFELPPIPCYRGAIPRGSQCVSLDGKIYVLGGELDFDGPCSDKVFVLDVAGQRLWKECASMKRPRSDFGCGVVGGKIYVCGGSSSTLDHQNKHVRQLPGESEVYDPEKNLWRKVAAMKSLRFNHWVETVGEELFVHGGLLLDGKFFDEEGKRRTSRFLNPRPARNAEFLEIYHPEKDEWRVVEPFQKTSGEVFFESKTFFGAQGKFFSLTKKRHQAVHDIHILEADQHSWTHLHSFSLAGALGPVQSTFIFLLVDVLLVDDELVAKLHWCNEDAWEDPDFVFVQSRGFGSKRKEITWQKLLNAPSSLDFPLRYSPFLRYPIQL